MICLLLSGRRIHGLLTICPGKETRHSENFSLLGISMAMSWCYSII